MEITRAGTQVVSGPPDYFTGEVTIASMFNRSEPSRLTGAIVTFQPGSRTAWHSHPLGQTLFVTAGIGWTQCEDGPIVAFKAGDVIYCPPNHRHWHGASPTSPMTHVAVQEMLDGKNVTWMEKVTDEEYHRGPG